MIQIYGIPNCGSVKKALAWFENQGTPYTFHNFKKEGLALKDLEAWLKACGPEVVLNRKGLGWRQCDESTRQAALQDPAALKDLLMEKPILIKRPVVVLPDHTVIIGVNEEAWAAKL